MRIGVDLSPLRPPLTGIGNYELNLLNALLSRSDVPEMAGFGSLTWSTVKKESVSSAEASQAADRPPVLARVASSVSKSQGLRRLYGVLRQRAFERGVSSRALSLFHAFAYLAPGATSVPVISVVYDVSFVRFPETHPPERVRMLQRLGPQLETGFAIHTISQFSAREINEVFGVPLSRITVIYPGVNPVFVSDIEVSDASLAQYGLGSRKYFLAVSTLEPRKNLRSLILAYSRLPKSLRTQSPLCVVGARGWGKLDLPSCSGALEREGALRFFGYVPNLHLKALYKNATAMLYPSLYEGFGMPIIEALACGTPVVSADTSSMPEAAGTVASLVSPLDVEAWSREMQMAIERPGALEDRQKRREHALKFSWDRAAEQTMYLYRTCALQ